MAVLEGALQPDAGSFFVVFCAYSSEGGSFPRPVRPLPLLRFVTASGHNPRRARPFRVLFRNGCRSGCPEGNACNGIRPNMRESCIAIALGGMFRTLRRLFRNRNLSGAVPEGLFMGPLRFFRPLVRFGAQYPSVCPVCRPVGCMRRTPECPSILPVSSRSPDRTDPKTHAWRKSRTKMQ